MNQFLFSYVARETSQSLRKPYHNGYIERVYLQYEFSDVLQDENYMRKSYHTCCIEMISPQYEFSDVLQDDKSARKSYHTCCIEMASPVFVLNSLWLRNLFVIIIANVDTMFIYLLYSYNIFKLFMLLSY